MDTATLPPQPHSPAAGGILNILDPTGHTELAWEVGDAAATRIAKDRFNALVGPNRELRAGAPRYAAFRVNPDGSGRQIDRFDPTASRIDLVPPLAGG